MEAEKILKLMGRARSVATKWGYSQHADDFAQEVFIAVSNGAYPKLEWLFIEFLRREYGSSRTISGRLRQLAEKYAVRLDAPVTENDNSGLNHDIVGRIENDSESVEPIGRTVLNYGPLNGRTKDIAVMHFEGELTNVEIGEILGIHEKRVCQIIKEAKHIISLFTEYESLKEKTMFDDNFMEIKLA